MSKQHVSQGRQSHTSYTIHTHWVDMKGMQVGSGIYAVLLTRLFIEILGELSIICIYKHVHPRINENGALSLG